MKHITTPDQLREECSPPVLDWLLVTITNGQAPLLPFSDGEGDYSQRVQQEEQGQQLQDAAAAEAAAVLLAAAAAVTAAIAAGTCSGQFSLWIDSSPLLLSSMWTYCVEVCNCSSSSSSSRCHMYLPQIFFCVSELLSTLSCCGHVQQLKQLSGPFQVTDCAGNLFY